MRFQSKILFSVFCLVLMSFVFMSTEQTANAQDWCCNNNNAMGGTGQCVQSPNGIQSCGGANVFFEDGVNGIILAPLGPTDPPFPQSGDLCPNAAQDRETCMCIDGTGATVPCQTLPPPPTDPPPTDPPPTNPPPTSNPELGCCVESQGLCSLETSVACPVPPNEAFLGLGTTCTNEPLCVPPPTPTPTPTGTPPPTEMPGTGCCVEAEGLCSITTPQSCSVPPNLEFLGIDTNCENVAACNLPPQVTEVPTISEWGLIATALMLGLFSLITVRRGFRINNK
ncbi:MAG: IPTL-CTERM sorting domain-containing protein [Thermodesulfobacteriota bacterium]